MVLRKSPYRVWTPLAVAAFVVFASCPAAAQWAWKDDNGRTVYSDRPPPASVNTDRIVRQPPNKQTVLPTPVPVDPSAKPAPDGKPAALSDRCFLPLARLLRPKYKSREIRPDDQPWALRWQKSQSPKSSTTKNPTTRPAARTRST